MTTVPRIVGGEPLEDVAPNLKALIEEVPGPAWTEYCNLANDNQDMKLLLGRNAVTIARLKKTVELYKDCHESCVRALHYLDPPSDL